MDNDAPNPQSSAPGGYISFVTHIWVGDNGKLIRGTIEDTHTGTRLALDLSELVAFLRTSLMYSPGQAQSSQNQGEEGRDEEPLADIQDDHVPDLRSSEMSGENSLDGDEGGV